MIVTRFKTEWLGETLRGFKFDGKETYLVLRDVAKCLGRTHKEDIQRMKNLVIELWGDESIRIEKTSILRDTSCDPQNLRDTSCDDVVINNKNNNNIILVSDEGAKSIVLHFKPSEPKKKYEGWEIDYENKRETWRKFNRFVIELLKKYERETDTDSLRELSKGCTNEFRDKLVSLKGDAKDMGACQGQINIIINELFSLKGLVKRDETYEMLEIRNDIEKSYIRYLEMFGSKSIAYNMTRKEFGLDMKKEIKIK